MRFTTTGPGVPRATLTVGVGDQEMSAVSLSVPVVVTFGLVTGAKAAVQHHHQWGRSGESLWPVDVKGPADTARLDGLRGIADWDAAGIGRPQRMTAAKAPASEDGQYSDETNSEHPNPSRPHDPIVAAGAYI